MMPSGKITALAGVAAVAVSLSGVAAASVLKKHTRAGQARARADLIGRAVLGSGWYASAPTPKSVPALTCSAFDPTVRGATEIGAAASATFTQNPSGPFVAQESYVYGAPAEQRLVWGAVVRTRLGRCLKASLVHGGANGVTFTATGVRRLSLAGVPGRSALFRVSGDATAPYQSVPVFLDVILVGRGAGISELSLSSFIEPAGHRLELRLARAIARRMTAS
jgi:hypothetical protein